MFEAAQITASTSLAPRPAAVSACVAAATAISACSDGWSLPRTVKRGRIRSGSRTPSFSIT